MNAVNISNGLGRSDICELFQACVFHMIFDSCIMHQDIIHIFHYLATNIYILCVLKP